MIEAISMRCIDSKYIVEDVERRWQQAGGPSCVYVVNIGGKMRQIIGPGYKL